MVCFQILHFTFFQNVTRMASYSSHPCELAFRALWRTRHSSSGLCCSLLPVNSIPLVRNLPLKDRPVLLSSTMCFTVLEKAARNTSLEVFVQKDFRFSWIHTQEQKCWLILEESSCFFEQAASFSIPTSNVLKSSNSSDRCPGLCPKQFCSVLLTLGHFN